MNLLMLSLVISGNILMPTMISIYISFPNHKFIFNSYFRKVFSNVIYSLSHHCHFFVKKSTFSCVLGAAISVESIDLVNSTIESDSDINITDSLFHNIFSNVCAGGIKIVSVSVLLTIRRCSFINVSCIPEQLITYSDDSFSRGGNICLFKGKRLIFDKCCYENSVQISSLDVRAIVSMCSMSHNLSTSGFICKSDKIHKVLIEMYYNAVSVSSMNCTNTNYGFYNSFEPYYVNNKYLNFANSSVPLYLATFSPQKTDSNHLNFLNSRMSMHFWKSKHYISYAVFRNVSLTISYFNSAVAYFSNCYSDSFVHSTITISMATLISVPNIFSCHSFIVSETPLSHTEKCIIYSIIVDQPEPMIIPLLLSHFLFTLL